ncbi:hypothetical protein BC937DRAFT_93784 [Endogone sp. FLAS-F59071]|nr:hypothetical protein BC937DRAFT_93784 [Endogone sp. FLAS-F59071]|eukprot:RUS14461.1 hypothetical protein BC937DRAFT_93784 [Endogone sp. FLAS-F59071]
MLGIHESSRPPSDSSFARSNTFYSNTGGFSSPSFSFTQTTEQDGAATALLDERGVPSGGPMQHHHHLAQRTILKSPSTSRRPSTNRVSPPYGLADRSSHNVPTPPSSTSPGPGLHRDMISDVRTNNTVEQSDNSDNDDFSTLSTPTKRANKTHVPSACVNCKRAHLACDVSRPCKRCVSLGKTDSCIDIQHKKRGRPKLRDKKSFIPTNMMGENKYAMPGSLGFLINGTMPFTMQPPSGSKAYPSVDLNTHAASPKFVHSQLPTSASAHYRSATSSFSMTVPTLNDQQDLNQQRVITVYLSMEICCARVSDEVFELWGYYPQELAHRSLYDFVSSNDTDRLSRLHRLLLDNIMQVGQRSDPHYRINSLPPTERTSSDSFFHTSPMILSTVAAGSQTFSDTLHIKKSNGDYELFEVKVYLGGGLGADLMNPVTYSKLYVVAMLTKHQYTVNSPASPIEVAVATAARVPTVSSPPVTAHSQTLASLGGGSKSESFHSEQPPYTFNRDKREAPSPSSVPSKITREATSSSTLHFGDSTSSPKIATTVSSRASTQQLNLSPPAPTTSSSPPTSSTSTFRLRPTTSTGKSGLSPTQITSGNFTRSSNNSFSSSGSYPYTPSASFGPSNHPTQQYFVQTSSSTLNVAAASTAQLYHPRPLYNAGSAGVSGPAGDSVGSDMGTHLSAKPTTKRMSVNSLLC